MGFMLKLPTPRVLEHDECGRAWDEAGLQYSFENGGDCYFKTAECERVGAVGLEPLVFRPGPLETIRTAAEVRAEG